MAKEVNMDKDTLLEAARICMVELSYGPITIPKLNWQIAEELRALAALEHAGVPEGNKELMEELRIQAHGLRSINNQYAGTIRERIDLRCATAMEEAADALEGNPSKG